MPEGDTVFRTAAKVRAALAGEVVERIDGSHAGLRANADRLQGHEAVSVRSYGKHLFVDFDSRWTIRTHLGMSGSWHVYASGRPWRRDRGAARVVLTAGGREVVCFAAPDVHVERTRVVDLAIARLGPDLAVPDLDLDDFSVRASQFGPGRSIAEVLTDQRILAGAGNVYKSEVLFLERQLPRTPFEDLDTATLHKLARRAHRLLRANLGNGIRSTTGTRVTGRELWVYGRAGRPCRRCGAAILDEHLNERITFWCPRCQA